MLPEWPKIGAVTKTSRCNGDQLATLIQEHHREGEKGCIQIARLDIEPTQHLTRARLATEFLVRRIENGNIELGKFGLKQARVQHVDGRFDKIGCANFPLTVNSDCGACLFARSQR